MISSATAASLHRAAHKSGGYGWHPGEETRGTPDTSHETIDQESMNIRRKIKEAIHIRQWGYNLPPIYNHLMHNLTRSLSEDL